MEIDWKNVGLLAKDLVIGVGIAAAGAQGGPAAAGGVTKAGDAIDRALAMAGVEETREKRFDRADFAARGKAKRPAPNEEVEEPPPKETIREGEPAPGGEKKTSAGPYVGDALRAADTLRERGWAREKVQQILGGPHEASFLAIVGREVKGFRGRGEAGTAIPGAGGATVRGVTGGTVAQVEGTAVRGMNRTEKAEQRGLAPA